MKYLYILILLHIPQFLYANEVQTRNKMDKNILSLISKNNFYELEELAKQYREEKDRTSSGLWMLTLFYNSIENAITSYNKNSKKEKKLISKFNKWIKKYPDSPTPYIAKSLLLLKQAWRIRGGGYANTVDDAAWKPFFKKVNQAKKILNKRNSIANNDPHWYSVMVRIATLESWDEIHFTNLKEDGLKKYPDYFQLYFNIINYYAPKWHGNANKIEKFARNALKRTKYIEGNGVYTRIYWVAMQVQFKGRLFEDSKVDWKTMRSGIDDILKKYPDQWNINNFEQCKKWSHKPD